MAISELTRRHFALGAGAALALPTVARAAPAVVPARLGAVAQMARELGVRALVVVRRGETILSDGDVDVPLRIASIRKSLLSALFGLAEPARASLDMSLAQLGIDDHPPLTTDEKSATVRHLLTARSGVYLPTAAETPAMRAARPARGSHAPGSFWYYNNWDFNALGEIYQRLTGEDLFLAIDHRLARPLGWQDFDPVRHTRWFYDAASPRFAAYNLQLSARDLARFGQMFLSPAGTGAAPVPPGWIEDSTRVHSITGRGGFQGGYGYMWWVATDRAGQDPGGVPVGSFSAAGNGGRYLTIVPSSALVIAVQPHETPGQPPARLYSQAGAYTRLVRDIVRAAG